MTLWHFTCGHGYRAIGKRGILKPNPHPLLPELGPVVWLTVHPMPSRDAVGLSSRTLRCDRMAYRYRVRLQQPVHWPDVRDRAKPEILRDLEAYGEPETWWLAFEPVAGVLA